MKKIRILLYGYGNPGRQDDGLGVAIVDFFEKKNLPYLDVDSNYQLNAEDACALASHDLVIFADASKEDNLKDFSFKKLQPASEITFTTHAMSAASVLALCEDVYNKSPQVYMLGIKGYEWDFKEGLSEKAKINFEKAIDFLTSLLEEPLFDKFNSAIK